MSDQPTPTETPEAVDAEAGTEEQPSLWRILAAPVALALSAIALLFGIMIGVGLEDEESAAPTTPTTTQPSDNAEAEALFASQGCGGCHVLTAAGSEGAVGPNLDETQLTEPEIAAIIANGRGAMPAFSGSLAEDEIAALAAYVAASGGP
jgi:mono/diheme cytochrome c family protein